MLNCNPSVILELGITRMFSVPLCCPFRDVKDFGLVTVVVAVPNVAVFL